MTTASLTFFFLSLRSYYLVNHTQRSQLFIRGAHFLFCLGVFIVYIYLHYVS